VHRLVILGLLAVATTAPAAGAERFPSFRSACARDDFAVAGGTVRAELCSTQMPGGRAAVVLHGCGGFSTFDHRLAVELPRYGISTLYVDYFGLTPPPGNRGFCGAHGAVANAFPTWIKITDAAAAELVRTPGIDPLGVGVVGWSLGGGVALVAATVFHQPRPFAAVAGFSTGSSGGDELASLLPPTILLSGGRTDAIPLAETLPLYHALQAAHVPSELYVYPHGSHAWPGRQGTLGIEHAAAFLRRYLR
jgi:dienelactone hydrolase